MLLMMKSPSILSASAAASSTGVINITSEGALDWSQWGVTDADSWNHKDIATSLISDVTESGGSLARWEASAAWPELAWTDGTPTASGSTYALVYIAGTGGKLSLTAAASSQLRRLKMYLGTYEAEADLTLSMSDGSVTPVVLSLDSSGEIANKWTVTVDFRCRRSGQTLNAAFENLSGALGNVYLQGVTLA